MKAIEIIEKFERVMDKISMPIVVVCGIYLFGRVLVSFVFNI